MNNDNNQNNLNQVNIEPQPVVQPQPVAPVVEQPAVAPQPVVTPQPVVEPKKKGKGGLIAIIIVLLLLIGGGIFAYFKFFRVTPYSYYQTIINNGLDELFSGVRDDKIYQMDTTLDFDTKLDEKILPRDVADIINNVIIKSSLQFDKESSKLVSKFDSNYGSEHFFTGDLFIDLKDSKAYLHSTDLIDAYLEMPTISLDGFDRILATSDNYDFKTIEKVLKREIPKLIKEEDCSKEDNYYVLKLNNRDLVKRLASMLQTLQKDEEFLKAIGTEIADDFKKTEFNYNEANFPEEKTIILVKSNDKGFNIESEGLVVTGDIKGDTTTFKATGNNKEILSGSVTSSGNVNDRKVSLSLTIPEMGTVKLDLTNKYKKISKVDEVDQSKVKLFDKLTQQEQNTMAENISKSKFYTVFQGLNGSMSSDLNQTAIEGTALSVSNAAQTFYTAFSAKGYDSFFDEPKCISLDVLIDNDYLNIDTNTYSGSVLISRADNNSVTYKIYLSNGDYTIDGDTINSLFPIPIASPYDSGISQCNGEGEYASTIVIS